MPAAAAERWFWLTRRNRMCAVAVWERTLRASASLCFSPGADPAVAAFYRKTLSGVSAAAMFIRTERTRVSFIRVAANPILVWARVAIFFETEVIEQSPHVSKFSGVDEGQTGVNERDQDKTVGKRNVHEKPELEQALRGILEVNILCGFDPITHFNGDGLFGAV